MEKINFFGILKGLDIENINYSVLAQLIEKDILIFEYDLTGEDLEAEKKYFLEHPGELNETFSLNSIGFYFDFKSYSFNNEIFNQMLGYDQESIEYNSNVENEIIKIDFEIEREINLQRRINIIEFYYNKYLGLIKNTTESFLIDEYLLYKNGTKSSISTSWLEIYKENITGSGDMTPLLDFLRGKRYFYNIDMKKNWELIYRVSKVCEFCISKNQALANPEYKSQIVDESNLIFKDDGLQILQHIIANHNKTLSPSFFSHLFFYLKKNDKLADSGQKSNKLYVDFAKNYGVKMSKVIQMPDYSPKRNTMYNTFDQYLKNYSNAKE